MIGVSVHVDNATATTTRDRSVYEDFKTKLKRLVFIKIGIVFQFSILCIPQRLGFKVIRLRVKKQNFF